jgi:hypothetical protein
MMPAPARGNIVRKIGEELKKNLNTLGNLNIHKNRSFNFFGNG